MTNKNDAVDFKEIDSNIVQLTMQDRTHKNTFSMELMDGLRRSFELIKARSNYKVVILTGYDTYFCCGGTQESLLGISAGKFKFTDASSADTSSLYSFPLDCKIPVISAMQGHGIGGGFAMGMFADFVILSRESIYTANFMKYGFTPGMGASYILPKKLGLSLAEEMMFTAGNYYGAELEKRGIPFPVLPRNEVLNHAYKLAQQLAEKPRSSLILLKDHLVANLRDELPGIIEQEVLMHEKTFHQPEVKERIMKLFGR